MSAIQKVWQMPDFLLTMKGSDRRLKQHEHGAIKVQCETIAFGNKFERIPGKVGHHVMVALKIPFQSEWCAGKHKIAGAVGMKNNGVFTHDGNVYGIPGA